MNTRIFNFDPVVRRGIERWENEGGLIRFDMERPNRWNPARDCDGHWRPDPPNFADAAEPDLRPRAAVLSTERTGC